MKIRIYQASHGQWNIQIKAKNGNVLLTASGYNTWCNAKKSLVSVFSRVVAGNYTVTIEKKRQ